MAVDISGFILGIDDRLISVKAVIAGNSVADGDCDQIIGNALETEEFESDQYGSDSW